MTSIVIVNFNSFADTFACVESIKKSITKEKFSIIIVDNCSTDESFEKLKFYSKDKNIVLIKAEENKGYCAGNNAGIKYALEIQKAGFIWILNPDTIVDVNALENLNVYAKSKENLGILGCMLIYYPDSTTIQSLGGGNYSIQKYGDFAPDMHLFHLQNINHVKLPESVEIDLVNGASMYIPAETFKKVGLMNEKFFMYSDENEFCIRVLDAGLKNYGISNARVYHKEGIRQSRKAKRRATYYLCRNQLYMTEELRKFNLNKKKLQSFIRCLSLIKHFEFDLLWYHLLGIIDYYRKIEGKKF